MQTFNTTFLDGIGEQSDPVDRLAAAVQRHVETDGEEPVDPACGTGVLLMGVNDPRAVAAILYLAHDAIVGGDLDEASHRILRVANALAGNDQRLAVIGRFYAG
ncbi:hypothetical protein [Azospirillum sp. TSO5]|uniref:hypothetical protein n=1 Tax=Azospirillum sp. TSO5 TaxID=716760 RepID=UPI000D621CBE|nr:hypothetical protein [Azospirillum sp. TSO5]PWC98057.1 hypothetical protein TSO5_03385 [Azospirillum sp. TSO5]